MIKLKKPKSWHRRQWQSFALLPFCFIYLVFYYGAMLFSKLKKILYRKSNPYQGNRKICVGNIVIGGTGKTPVCNAIGEFLKLKKHNPCFISKGYKRLSKADIAIPFQYGQIFDYRLVGDESILLSSTADTFVLKDRKKCIFNTSHYSDIIFDDGLQDESMEYDIKIAVFDCNFFIGNGFALPAGPMRDILSFAIKKVNKIILTNYHEKHLDKIDYLCKFVNRKNIHTAKLQIINHHDKNFKYIAFAGIGHNEKFFQTLVDNDFNITYQISFEDHVLYTKQVLDRIIEYAKQNDAKIITTTKDFVKIPIDYHSDISYLEIKYDIENIDALLES